MFLVLSYKRKVFAMYLFILLNMILLNQVNTQFLYNIEDIPIENYEPSDLQENDMDIELLPRIERSSFNSDDDDPKVHFFRFMKSLKEYDENNYEPTRRYKDLPRPGGLRNIYNNDNKHLSRPKRSNVIETTTETIKNPADIEKQLGKPLELSVLSTENITEANNNNITTTTTTSTTSAPNLSITDNGNFLINDFIRFKRQSTTENSTKPMNFYEAFDMFPQNNSTNDMNRPKRNQAEKLQLESTNTKNTDERPEARGATKEQWVKQIYPVRRNDDLYDDNSQISSESVRAPRVHFVTQRRNEILPPSPTYHLYDRESRARNLDKEIPRDLPTRDLPGRDLSREFDYYYHQPRYTRHYNPIPPPPPPYYRYDNYYRFDSPRDLYEREPDNYYSDRDRNNFYNGNKQRRIIYYATLPDVSRTPPNVDLRDRYNNYRDRYDDRYAPNRDDSYRFRKTYPSNGSYSNIKARYDENERNKTPYPLKVSTDVNVREIKKNPERRIYSEVDRNRYAFKSLPPYQNERN